MRTGFATFTRRKRRPPSSMPWPTSSRPRPTRCSSSEKTLRTLVPVRRPALRLRKRAWPEAPMRGSPAPPSSSSGHNLPPPPGYRAVPRRRFDAPSRPRPAPGGQRRGRASWNPRWPLPRAPSRTSDAGCALLRQSLRLRGKRQSSCALVARSGRRGRRQRKAEPQVRPPGLAMRLHCPALTLVEALAVSAALAALAAMVEMVETVARQVTPRRGGEAASRGNHGAGAAVPGGRGRGDALGATERCWEAERRMRPRCGVRCRARRGASWRGSWARWRSLQAARPPPPSAPRQQRPRGRERGPQSLAGRRG